MSKPYALSLYQPATVATPRFQRSLTSKARGWKRSIRSNGGPWLGSFALDGSPQELQEAFEGWLGYTVNERAAGMLSWSGLIYEMDLTHNGITRRRSLDLMVNRVKTTYTKESFGGENFARNPGFDYASVVAGNDNFDSWYENTAATGGIEWENGAGLFHGGIASMRMTGNGDSPLTVPWAATLTYTRQNITVTPGAKYQLTFWVRGDGVAPAAGSSGSFGVRDPNASIWLVGPQQTFWSAASWKQYTGVTFIGPSDGEVMLFFFAPSANGRICYFDDVELLEFAPNLFESTWATIDNQPLGDIAVDDPALSPPIVRYGVKEEVIHLDDYPEATSISYRDTFLKENAYPWPRPVAAGKKNVTTLEIMVAGWVWTMNWLYLQNHTGDDDTIDAWLRLIVGSAFGRSPEHGGTTANAGDCQFVRYLNVQANALTVGQRTAVEERPWDVIQELTNLGDGAENLWRAWVDPGRYFHYTVLNTAPRYYIRKDGIYDTMAGRVPSNPWLMQPAVFRDMTYRSRATEHGLFLPDPRDMYVEEVEMADGWDQAQLKTALFSEADLLLRAPDRGEEDTGPTYQYKPG